MMPSRIVARFGKPCSGKGAEGKALQHFHKGLHFKTLTMRQIIALKSEKCEKFKDTALQCEADGVLIPLDKIKPVLHELPRLIPLPRGTLFFDGIPRDPEQVFLMHEVFRGCEIIASESVARDDYCLQVFRATLNAPDREGRLDAEEALHNKRVEIYKKNLSDILAAIKKVGWTHVVHNAEQPLKNRFLHLEKVAKLHPVQKHLLRNLEETLGLPQLKIAPV